MRFLIDDSVPIENRLTAVLEGRYRVEGAGLNFLTKVLAAHNPMKFTVYNEPVAKALKYFEYDMPYGLTAAQKYLEFSRLMEGFRIESGARNAFDVDAFFYNYWEQNIKS
ncbi:MAG: hypothetical protein JO033_22250 [Acidobacteriaceae bacterium]|nr:hypothetical protein [Acidobacteriaceae bacterium]MBV9502089.1 hypothetical protein [Acidobacteriaceae bacterium]